MIQPLAGKYLCEIVGDMKTLPSGLILADTVKEIPHRARVLAAGKDKLDEKQSAQVNDIVHFHRVWDRELSKNKEMIFLKEEEIVGVERNN